jgi:hypothetical protein
LPEIVNKDLKTSENAWSSKRKEPIGMHAFNIYLAGRPPGSGEVSLIINEKTTKFLDAHIIKMVNGIKNTMVPTRFTHALVLGENFV